VTILRIFECQNKSLEFIMNLINRELNATSERNVLFRINSLATRGTDIVAHATRTIFNER